MSETLLIFEMVSIVLPNVLTFSTYPAINRIYISKITYKILSPDWK